MADQTVCCLAVAKAAMTADHLVDLPAEPKAVPKAGLKDDPWEYPPAAQKAAT